MRPDLAFQFAGRVLLKETNDIVIEIFTKPFENAAGIEGIALYPIEPGVVDKLSAAAFSWSLRRLPTKGSGHKGGQLLEAQLTAI